MLREHELMHDLARVGPVTVADVVITKPSQLYQAVDRKRCDGVWTCDDLSEIRPTVPVQVQHHTKAALLNALFDNTAEREFYHVKRDGVAEAVVVLLEPTFKELAKNIRFRYLVKHGEDSNTRIIVVQT